MVGVHFWMKAYSKPDTPQGAGVQVRYLKREGEFAPVHYLNRTSKTTKDYADFVDGNTQHLPSWAANDPERFFRQAATSEGANRYYMFQVQFSLPRELTDEQQQALRQDFMEATMPNLPAMWVMHNKQLDSGEMHPHIHILLSARKDDGIERDPEQTFKRWDARVPERGGCQKDLFWSQSQAPEQLRQAFADVSNYHLERANLAARVDLRALKRREIQRDAIGHGGERPDVATLVKEQAQAAAAWEQRKAYKGLGNVHDMPREEMVMLVRQWTRDYERGQQLPRGSREEVRAWEQRRLDQLRAQERTLAHSLHTLETYQERLQQAHTQEQHYSERGLPLPMARQLQSERVLAEARTHGLPPDQDAERALAASLARLGVREQRLPRFQEELVLPEALDDAGGGRVRRVRIWEKRDELEERRSHDER